MSFDITILSKKVAGLKEAFNNGRYADALVAALNTGNGLMQQRVFQEHVDVKGQSFGTYIGKKSKAKRLKSKNRTDNKRLKALAGLELTSYQRKRSKRGRQVAFKDLELEGKLRRAIETQVAEKETERSAILQFTDNQTAKIARGQEQQITNIRNGLPGTTKGTGAIKIFNLSESEKEQVTEQGALLIKKILKP